MEKLACEDSVVGSKASLEACEASGRAAAQTAGYCCASAGGSGSRTVTVMTLDFTTLDLGSSEMCADASNGVGAWPAHIEPRHPRAGRPDDQGQSFADVPGKIASWAVLNIQKAGSPMSIGTKATTLASRARNRSAGKGPQPMNLSTMVG